MNFRLIFLCRISCVTVIQDHVQSMIQITCIILCSRCDSRVTTSSLFVAALPCMVDEPPCCFAHNELEIYFWNMDRTGAFSIEAFIDEQRQNVFRGGCVRTGRGCEGSVVGGSEIARVVGLYLGPSSMSRQNVFSGGCLAWTACSVTRDVFGTSSLHCVMDQGFKGQ